MKFAAMSWKAKPSASPITPTPASSEVTVLSRCNSPSAKNTARPITVSRVTVDSKRLMASLCVIRRRRRCTRAASQFDASSAKATISTAIARFGSITIKPSSQPASLS